MPSNLPSEEMFDVRKVERLLNDGTITQEQYDAFLSGLPDEADGAETSGVQMVRYDRSRAEHGAEGPAEEDEG